MVENTCQQWPSLGAAVLSPPPPRGAGLIRRQGHCRTASSRCLMERGRRSGHRQPASGEGPMRRPVVVLCAMLVLAAVGVVDPSSRADAAPTTTPFSAVLAGSNEVPPQGNGYSGGAIFTFSTGTLVAFLCAQVTLTLSPGDEISGVHINRGAAGVDGPVEISLSPHPADPTRTFCQMVFGAPVMAEIFHDPAAFYLEVDTESFADGAARGQLEAVAPTTSSTSATDQLTTMTSDPGAGARAVSASPSFTG